MQVHSVAQTAHSGDATERPCAKQEGSLSIAHYHNISFTKQLGVRLALSSGAVKQPSELPDRPTLAAV